MSKFSLFQSGKPVFRPTDDESGSVPLLQVVAFFALIGILLVAIRSIWESQKPPPSPDPAPAPGSAFRASITNDLLKMPAKPPFVP